MNDAEVLERAAQILKDRGAKGMVWAAIINTLPRLAAKIRAEDAAKAGRNSTAYAQPPR